jgi:hypothetical protein
MIMKLFFFIILGLFLLQPAMALKPSKLSPQDKQKAEERRKEFLELQQQHLAQLHVKPRIADPQRAAIVQRLQEAIKSKDKHKADMFRRQLIIMQKNRFAQRRQMSREQLIKEDLF